MFTLLLKTVPEAWLTLCGMIVCFAGVFAVLTLFRDKLPRDQGREFAVAGQLSQGKPRGAGIVFVAALIVAALLFAPISIEMVIYLVLTAAAMMTGFLDDAAAMPWGELKKGLLDAAIAIIAAITYVAFNGSDVALALTGTVVHLPAVVYCLLAIVLIWASINVTNCSDGVDGLSGTLSIVTMMSFYFMNSYRGMSPDMNPVILMFVMGLVSYLWFNATPSLLMMGDAGSRAMGFFIAILAMRSGDPFMFIPLALILILDGGLGLIKVSLLRFLKISIMKTIRTPLHDHVRKNRDWSNTQAVFRFAIIQIAISVFFLFIIKGM